MGSKQQDTLIMSSAMDGASRSYLQNTLLGVAAGCIEVSIMQPTVYWKNTAQQRRPFSMNPALVYRGLTVNMLNMGLLTGLQMPVTSSVQRLIKGDSIQSLTHGETIASSLIGGFVSGIVSTPLELIIVQQQNLGKSIPATALALVRQHGTSVLGRGMIHTCMREAIYTSGYLGMAPVLSDILKSKGSDPGHARFMSAVIAGTVGATLSHPFDTIKTCLQGDTHQVHYRSTLQTARLIYSESGIAGFYRGFSFRTARTICSVYILTAARDTIAGALGW
eukprot:m.198158 g.198158  ORF g.198158 m.198158 type:complete len:278 (-) comp14915_c0_seq1:538-1371(-)